MATSKDSNRIKRTAELMKAPSSEGEATDEGAGKGLKAQHGFKRKPQKPDHPLEVEQTERGPAKKQKAVPGSQKQPVGKGKPNNPDEEEKLESKSQPATKEAKTKKAKVTVPKNMEEQDVDMEVPEDAGNQALRTSRAGRRTKNVNYNEGGKQGALAVRAIAIEEETKMDSEAAAIQDVAPGCKAFRLADFDIQDDSGEQQPLDRVKHQKGPLWVSGVVHPTSGALSKKKGRRVIRFGPILDWRVSENDSDVQIMLRTPSAEYACLRPSVAYKKLFAHLTEQAEIASEVARALNPNFGGSPSSTIEEVVARLSRAKVGKGYSSAREALLLNGNFVISHLKAFDSREGNCLAESPLVASLQQEVTAMQEGGGTRNGAIVINEGRAAAGSVVTAVGSAEKRRVQADADYARQLQAKMDAQQARAANKRGGSKGTPYIKISEAEIADDYPEPTPYEKVEEETDELLLADEDLFDVDPESLPRRLLSDFSVYNSEGMMSTLELLPMWGGAEPDVELFASGNVVDDDGEWAGGQSLEASVEGAGCAGGSNSSAPSSRTSEEASMRIYSSQIQEWVVEFSCDMLFISIRTDVAWYRLARPAAKYAAWYNVVLKSARVAVKTLTLLSEEARASRLSFADVVKRLAATEEADPTFISKKGPAVERFVVVHGQILLNQFQNYPVKAVKNSAFAATLKDRMELRRHAKLYSKSVKAAKPRSNSNPMKDRASVRAKPMTATATTLVRSIWQSYFPSTSASPQVEISGAEAAVEVEEDLNEEDDEAEEEDALADAQPAQAVKEDALPDVKISWEGPSLKKAHGNTFYKGAKVGDTAIAVGDVVALAGPGESAQVLGLVQALWQTAGKARHVQLRAVARGSETVLAEAAAQDELFVTSHIFTRTLKTVASRVNAVRLERSWRLEERRSHMAADTARQERNAVASANKQAMEYVYRTLYLPEEGKFCQLPADLKLGELCAESVDKSGNGVTLTEDGDGLIKDGVEYRKGDFLFLRPGTFDRLADADGKVLPVAEYAARGRFHKGGANAGLRPYGIAQLAAVSAGDKKQSKDAAPSKVQVMRFYRPEDISQDQAYKADFWDVYASKEELAVDVDSIVSKCKVATANRPDDETFICCKTFDRATSSFSDPPASFELKASKGKGGAANKGKEVQTKDKGKGVASAPAATSPARKSTAVEDGISLASMDIFAGCGGLTEGLHQAGAAYAKWAIEYEQPAAEAFRLNHPGAVCWAENCNVILTAAMHKAGMADLCTGSIEAEEQAKSLDAETLNSLPKPGEVEFLCGGPPCQGYSGMNRFNKGNWSMVQNSMVMAYLSYADFYRPRYFLLENVRNFVSHNKSFTFRLTLRSLLDMGYQVRFGVLNAGNFGVSQSRKRTFIWAAAPGELLPDWPKLLHIFRSPQLTINLPGNVKYSAVPQTEGAPLRTVTVKDVISDLPPISNGQSEVEIAYKGQAVSAFQKRVRGEEVVLRDHICKEMNRLNLERCRCIPKNQPGADWRVLQEIVEKDPSRETYEGQPLVPWCLPNTADRHNGWRGLFGRLDWGGHFPTSTTDPQPMGKVGQVFHPDQDRIVSVRECARAQGFPDSFRFYGNVHNKHRQIGNAVPPPLAYSLGKCLRRALEETAAGRQNALLAAQMAAFNS